MPLTRDDIDAVSMMLHVDGELAFSILLTRGGLTQRLGTSDGTGPEIARGIMVKGRTDRCFEDFLATMPDAVLAEGGDIEDAGRDGPRHDWKFELGGGLETLVWRIAYHQGSASLPDEFADMVVQAERLTHAWYLAGVAEETGQPLALSPALPPTPKAAASPSAVKTRGPASRKPGAAPPARSGTTGRVTAGQGDVRNWPQATRERIATAVLLDLVVLGVPYLWLRALLPAGDGAGPPGAALVVFAFVEFALLQFLRRSPGYWMLGIRAPLGSSPRLDPAWAARESRATLVTGVLLCIGGAAALTSWTVAPAPAPWFGLTPGVVISTLLALLFGGAMIASGALLLRLDTRGVWIGAGTMGLLMLAVLLGGEDWTAWIRSPLGGGAAAAGEGAGGIASLLWILILLVPVGYGAGLGLAWKRFSRPLAAPRPAVAAR